MKINLLFAIFLGAVSAFAAASCKNSSDDKSDDDAEPCPEYDKCVANACENNFAINCVGSDSTDYPGCYFFSRDFTDCGAGECRINASGKAVCVGGDVEVDYDRNCWPEIDVDIQCGYPYNYCSSQNVAMNCVVKMDADGCLAAIYEETPCKEKTCFSWADAPQYKAECVVPPDFDCYDKAGCPSSYGGYYCSGDKAYNCVDEWEGNCRKAVWTVTDCSPGTCIRGEELRAECVASDDGDAPP